MKKHLLPLFLMLSAANVYAQQDFFALTGKDTPSIIFSDFRVLDGTTGVSGDKVFTADASIKVFSQNRGTTVTEDKNTYNNAQAVNMATLAYDPFNNNLVYMPMFSSNIYVLNAKTKEITLVENNVDRVTSCDINSHMTRMASGYGRKYLCNQ